MSRPCSITAGVLSCNFGDLAAGASRTVHISSPTTAASCGTVDNTATADAGNDAAVSDDASVVVQCPGLNVSKSPDQGTVSAGTAIGFTITVSNTGPGTATGVTLDRHAAGEGGAGVVGIARCRGLLDHRGRALVQLRRPRRGPVAHGAYLLADHGGVVRDDHQHGHGRLEQRRPGRRTPGRSSSNARTSMSRRLQTPRRCPRVTRSGSPSRSPTPGRERRPTSRSRTRCRPAPDSCGRSAPARIPGCAIAQGVLSCTFGTLAAGATRTVHISSPTTALSCATINNTATVDASNDDPLSDSRLGRGRVAARSW